MIAGIARGAQSVMKRFRGEMASKPAVPRTVGTCQAGFCAVLLERIKKSEDTARERPGRAADELGQRALETEDGRACACACDLSKQGTRRESGNLATGRMTLAQPGPAIYGHDTALRTAGLRMPE